MKQSARSWVFGVAVVILLVGIGPRLLYLQKTSLWEDELLSITRGEAPLDEFFSAVSWSGTQMPLYYLYLHLFPYNLNQELLLRFTSFLMSLIGIALMMRLTRALYHHNQIALFAGLLLAVNPYHIWLTRQGRAYGLLFVCALLASYFFLRIVREKRSWRLWTLFTTSTSVTYLTHFLG